MKMKLCMAAVLSVMSVAAFAADSEYGSAAPGTLKCSLSYLVHNPNAPELPQPPSCLTCTPISQDIWQKSEKLDLTSGFKYLYGGAKEATANGSDEQLTLIGSAQINANGYSSGNLIIRRGQADVVNVGGPVQNGLDLQVKLPVSGIQFKGQEAKSVMASCWIE